jgi:hypothetical protein
LINNLKKETTKISKIKLAFEKKFGLGGFFYCSQQISKPHKKRKLKTKSKSFQGIEELF